MQCTCPNFDSNGFTIEGTRAYYYFGQCDVHGVVEYTAYNDELRKGNPKAGDGNGLENRRAS